MNEESEMNIDFDFPHSCYFVLVGGKYLNRIGDVMEKVNSVVNDIGVRPEALFLISNSSLWGTAPASHPPFFIIPSYSTCFHLFLIDL